MEAEEKAAEAVVMEVVERAEEVEDTEVVAEEAAKEVVVVERAEEVEVDTVMLIFVK